MIKRLSNSILALLAASALLCAGNALAANKAGTYVQGHYAEFDDSDNDGFGIAGSWMVREDIRLFGEYTTMEFSDMAVLGGGYRLFADDQWYFELGASYQDFDLDDGGPAVHGLVDYEPIPDLTLTGKLEYLMYDEVDDQLVVGLGVDYAFTPEFSAFFSYEEQTDISANMGRLGVRYAF